MGTARYVEKWEWKDILRLMRRENSLAVRLALSTGLRISDVLALKKTDVERASETDGHVWITESKTGKRRRVYLGKKMRAQLRGIFTIGTPYVFSHRTRRGAHRTREAVYKDLCRVADLLRLSPGATPHSARKTYTVEYIRAGHSLLEAMRLLRHSSPGVTAIYAYADVMLGRDRRHRV